jgi:hypothetical protein
MAGKPFPACMADVPCRRLLFPYRIAQCQQGNMSNATIEILSGNNQNQYRLVTASGNAVAIFAPLSVRVSSGGVPLAGRQVSWSASGQPASMAVQTEPGGGAGSVTVTGADGVAVLARMGGNAVFAYHGDGCFAVTAACDGASAAFKQTVAGLAPPALALSVLSGDHQSVARAGFAVPGGKAVFGTLQVKLTDASGQPVPKADVYFRGGVKPEGMAIQMSSNSEGALLTTDANGIATLDRSGNHGLACYYAEGAFTIVAGADNSSTATFSLTVAPSAPPPAPIAGASLAVHAGDGQTQARNHGAGRSAAANFAALTVQLKGPDGVPLDGQQISWSSPSHPREMALQTEPGGGMSSITFTDANGMSTLNRMSGFSVRAYFADGPFTLQASHGSATALFHLTVG